MTASNIGTESSRIPEYRTTVSETFPVDLSGVHAFQSPPEHNRLDTIDPTGSAGTSVNPEASGGGGLRELEVLIPRGGTVLLFEPTLPDIRFTILQCGARYIDGGRLLNGRPDPSVLKYFDEHRVDLEIYDADDEIVEGRRAPSLIDARSRPYLPGKPYRGTYVLHMLGPRDGFTRSLGAWVEGLRDDDMGNRESPQKGEGISRALSCPGFATRAQERCERQEESLATLHRFADSAGFESLCRAGFLWVGLPGFTALEVQSAFHETGVGVFACAHHPYRHRVRLAPPDSESAKKLSLLFSRAYKILTK